MKKIKCEDFLRYALKLLTEYTKKFVPINQTLKQVDLDNIKIFAKNKIEENNFMKQIYELYSIIGLVRN